MSEEYENIVCDPENCCADCKHGTIPCEGLEYEPKTPPLPDKEKKNG